MNDFDPFLRKYVWWLVTKILVGVTILVLACAGVYFLFFAS